jgi:excinuclease ABC subunit C
MKSQDLKKLELPDKPGVYFWKDNKEILYIGKATSLRDRVRSYFSKDIIDTRGPGILDMTVQAVTVEYQETDSVLEALILEANLIKKYQPKYNTKEKDNKSFYQVIISDEEWPKVMIVRSRDLKIMEMTGRISRINFEGKIKYSFGPYPNGSVLRDAMKIIRKIFPFIDISSAKKDQQEFYKQLGLAPNVSNSVIGGGIARKEYLKNINNIRLFFEGKKGAVLSSLEKEMKTHAKTHEFELAEIAKRKIFALNHINDVALIKDIPLHNSRETFRIESYDIAHLSGKNTVGVMTVVTHGMVDKSEYRKFIIRSGKGNDDYGNLKEILTRRFNHAEWATPDLVVIDGGIGQYNVAEETLRSLDKKIPIISVIKDTHHKPKALHGDATLIKKYKKDILLANNESHRFAITFHKQKRGKDFLNL